MLFFLKSYAKKLFIVCKKKIIFKSYELLKIQFVMRRLFSLHYNLQKKHSGFFLLFYSSQLISRQNNILAPYTVRNTEESTAKKVCTSELSGSLKVHNFLFKLKF